jgi:hypothetical protein
MPVDGTPVEGKKKCGERMFGGLMKFYIREERGFLPQNFINSLLWQNMNLLLSIFSLSFQEDFIHFSTTFCNVNQI